VEIAPVDKLTRRIVPLHPFIGAPPLLQSYPSNRAYQTFLSTEGRDSRSLGSNAEILTPGVAPQTNVTEGTATIVATGGMIPFTWSYWLAILITVIIIGSVGSHIPKKLRHYSLIFGPKQRDQANNSKSGVLLRVREFQREPEASSTATMPEPASPIRYSFIFR
jgi:hypothetical protein